MPLPYNLQGVPEVVVRGFGLVARPVIVWSAGFLRGCSGEVARSGGSLVLAGSVFIFLSGRSFFAFFAPLACLDRIPFGLLLFGPARCGVSGGVGALACPLFGMSAVGACVRGVGLCAAGTVSQACDPAWQGSDLVSKSSYPVECGFRACGVVLAVHSPAS